MAKTFKETLLGNGPGIAGITRPVSDTTEEDNGYRGSGKKRLKTDGLKGRLGDITRAPVEIFVVGTQAVVGAGGLWLGRKFGIKDPSFAKTDEVESDETNIDTETEVELFSPDKWAAEILQTIDTAREIRRNREEVMRLAEVTLGADTVRIISNAFIGREAIDLNLMRVVESEIKLAQKVIAISGKNNIGSDEEIVDQQLNLMYFEKIRQAGISAVEYKEADDLRRLRENSEFEITSVSWWEGLLAAVGGATGTQEGSTRGGYRVFLNNGQVTLKVGQDPNAIAPPDQVTVDVDIPTIYEAAESVANGEVPLLRGKFARAIGRVAGFKENGEIELLPGRIDIGLIGSDDKASYPALQALMQKERIDRIRIAGARLTNRLMELEKITNEPLDDKIDKLKQEVIEEVQTIPRKYVVMMIIDNIRSMQKDAKTTAETVEDTLPVDLESIQQEMEITEDGEDGQLKNDLNDLGLTNMDIRTAGALVRNSQKYFGDDVKNMYGKDWERKFANVLNEAKRIVNK